MREKCARVDVNRVSPGRLHDWDAVPGDVIAEVSSRDDAVLEVVFVKRLIQVDGNPFEVASRKLAVVRRS